VSRFNTNAANWRDWREQSKLFEDIALTQAGANINFTGDGPPERVRGARTTWNLPQVLGIQPALRPYVYRARERRECQSRCVERGE
jgi:hypothetical protein